MQRVDGIGQLSRVVLDAADAQQLATFYADLTGWPAVPGAGDLALRSPAGPALAFQAVSDHLPPRWPESEYPHQIHLDLDVKALSHASAKAAALGATELGGGPHWKTFADPAGHPFDLCETGSVPPMSRLWVSIDAPDPSALARFYSTLLGLHITHDDVGGAALGGDGPLTVYFQPVVAYRAPRWPDPAHPQQAHLDLLVDNLDLARTKVMELGAHRLGDCVGGVVFADPAQHPFCLRASPAAR